MGLVINFSNFILIAYIYLEIDSSQSAWEGMNPGACENGELFCVSVLIGPRNESGAPHPIGFGHRCSSVCTRSALVGPQTLWNV